MSDRRTLHHADVEGADEDITVGAYQWIHSLRRSTLAGIPSITLWAGGATSECGCTVESLPAEVTPTGYPRLLGDLLAALGDAARTAGPPDTDPMDGRELDAYIAGLGHAGRTAEATAREMAGLRAAAISEKARREKAAAGDDPRTA